MEFPTPNGWGVILNPLIFNVYAGNTLPGTMFSNLDFLFMDGEHFLLMDGEQLLSMNP